MMSFRRSIVILAGLSMLGGCSSQKSEPENAYEQQRQVESTRYEEGNIPATQYEGSARDFEQQEPMAPPEHQGMYPEGQPGMEGTEQQPMGGTESYPPSQPAPMGPAYEQPGTPPSGSTMGSDEPPMDACHGLTRSEIETCPIDRTNVSKVSNIDSGVMVELRDGATAPEMERRMRCYQSKAVERMSTDATCAADATCPLSLPGVTVNVMEEEGTVTPEGTTVPKVVRIQLMTSDESQLPTLRQRTRAIRNGGSSSRGIRNGGSSSRR